MGDLWDVGREELGDTFSSRKFLLVLGLFLLMAVGSVYMGVSEYQSAMERWEDGQVSGDVPQKPSLLEVFDMMVGANLPLAAGILALLLSYDVVSKEREEGTIELLLSYPIYRDEVINGKFVAGLFTVSVALLISFMASSGLAIYLTGRLPTLQQVYRLMFMWHGSIIYMAFFFGLGTLLSTVFRSSWRSLIAGLLVLLVSLATPFIAQIGATQLYTYDSGGGGGVQPLPGPGGGGTVKYQAETTASSGRAVEGDVVVDQPGREGPGSDGPSYEEVQRRRQAFVDRVSRFTPTYSYEQFVTTMMGTNYEGEEALRPSVMDSLRSSWGYLAFLLSQTLLMFTLAYAVFMRQDL